MSIIDSIKKNMAPIHQEGYPFIGAFALVSLILFWIWAPLGWIGCGLTVWCALFFRDPVRVTPVREGIVVSPADGRVLRVAREVDDYWQTEMTEIAIFLALQDVHVQRIPVTGEVVAQRRKAGGYKPAMTEAATHGNNQLATYLETSVGPCTVTQISGLIARRIVTWVAAGDRAGQGQRLGMIKFGSQVTLRLPVGTSEIGRAHV